MGSIRQRGKDSWQLQVTVGVDARGYADREYKTIRAKNISEARKELAKFEAELLSGNYIRPENMTLHQLYEKEWATKYAPINYGSKATLEENVKIIEKRLLPRFGHKKIKDIKTIHIVNYISELQKDGSRLDNKPGALSPSSIHNVYKAYNSLLKCAQSYGLIKENPAKGVKLPSKGSSKAQINYNKEQIWELIDAIKTEPFDKQVLFWIAFITSAREAEIAALDDNSILIDECAIRIDKSLGEMSGGGVEIIPTKNHLEGVAAIPETLMVMVEKLLLDKKKWKMLMRDKWEYPDNVFLFCNDHGRPIRPDSISQWWIRFIKKNQLPKVRFHDLRHISITFLISQNLPMKSISSRARHSKIGTTMDIYGHSIVEVDREAAQLFEQFFSKKEG